MINIKFIKNELNKYIDGYDLSNDKIKLKKEHIFRTAKLCVGIARDLNLSKDDVKLAEVIGLLHDIGRFEQIRVYNTFNDRESMDHAKLGIKVLIEDGFIDRLDIDKKYYRTIILAILNHNKNNIDSDMTDKDRLFCKIIRDADKLDIFNIMCSDEFETCFWYDDFNYVNPSFMIILEYNLFHKLNYKYIKSNVDLIIKNYALIYDFNFRYSYRYMLDKKYLDTLTNLTNDRFNSVRVTKLSNRLLSRCNKYMKRIGYGS